MRVSRRNKPWSADDDMKLEALAGTVSEQQLAASMGRSRLAVRWRCWRLGINPRANHGFLTVRGTAAAYGCPERRVRNLVQTGVLPAGRVPTGFLIDPADAEAVADTLRAPRKTWKL